MSKESNASRRAFSFRSWLRSRARYCSKRSRGSGSMSAADHRIRMRQSRTRLTRSKVRKNEKSTSFFHSNLALHKSVVKQRYYSIGASTKFAPSEFEIRKKPILVSFQSCSLQSCYKASPLKRSNFIDVVAKLLRRSRCRSSIEQLGVKLILDLEANVFESEINIPMSSLVRFESFKLSTGPV